MNWGGGKREIERRRKRVEKEVINMIDMSYDEKYRDKKEKNEIKINYKKVICIKIRTLWTSIYQNQSPYQTPCMQLKEIL